MTIIDTGFSEKAAERKAVEKDREKAYVYFIKRVDALLADCECGNLNADDVRAVAAEIKSGAHNR